MEIIKQWVCKNRRNIYFFMTAILVMAFLCVFIGLEIWEKIPGYATHVGNKDEEQFIYSLEEDVVIQQEFSCNRTFDFITLSFSDHDQVIQGKTIIQIDEKDTGNNIYYGEIENRNIHYGDYVEIPFAYGGEAEKVYLLTLYEKDTEGTLLGIFGYFSDGGQSAEINGEESEYAVSLGIHTETALFRKLVLAVSILLALMLLLCLWAVWKGGFKEENLFLCIAIPLGAAYLCLLSVNPVHDGATHLAKVYQYSNLLLGWDQNIYVGQVYLKADEKECFDSLYSENDRENEQAQICWEMYEDFDVSAERKPLLESHEYRETGASSVWEYFPGILGMSLGRLAGGSARFNLLLTKVFFFLFYIGACYYSIRTAPRLKTGIAFTALLPMALYQATGVTYDSVVISAILMLTALWLKARETALRGKDWVILLLLAYIAGCCKGGFYAVVLPLFFLIPSENAGGKRKKALLCSCLIGIAAIAVLTTSFRVYLPYLQGLLGIQEGKDVLQDAGQGVLAADGQTIVEVVPEQEIAAYGIMYIVREPFQCMRMLFHTIWEKMDYYMGSLIGYRMAWSDEMTPWFIIIFFYILLCISSGRSLRGADRNSQLKERTVCAILLGAEILAFHLLMLIETPSGSKVINGVQGRYFIAWIPVALMLWPVKTLSIEIKNIEKLYLAYGFAEVLYFCSFLMIFFL